MSQVAFSCHFHLKIKCICNDVINLENIKSVLYLQNVEEHRQKINSKLDKELTMDFDVDKDFYR
jgi:hypothetical protein